MAKKKKSAIEAVTGAVKGAAAAVVKAADANVVQPVGKALGLTEGDGKGGTKKARAERSRRAAKAKTPAAAPKPAAKKSSAAKVMTQSVAGKKTAAAKMMSGRVESAKPTPKPSGESGAKGPRRGASKGR